VSTPFIIAGPVILWRIYAYFTKGTIKISSTASAPPLVSWETRTSFAASRFASDQTGTGQLLVSLFFLFYPPLEEFDHIALYRNFWRPSLPLVH
jgi:hypothetical protein